jgi:hypothetical protein
MDETAATDASPVILASPNPFSSTVTLVWQKPVNEKGTLSIFDVSGRRIRLFDINGSNGRIMWDGKETMGREVVPGVYLMKLEAGAIRSAQRVVVLR